MDTVVLLHGLGRTRFSMAIAAGRLRKAGFRANSIGYRSLRRSIEEHAALVSKQLPDVAAGKLHFLTHSLGGIVLRQLAATNRPANLGRVVMLGPPNRGSRAAGKFRDWILFRSIFGPTGQQLVDDPEAPPNRLGPVDFELGVIAGNRGLTPLSMFLEGENDGVVSVREAMVEGAADFRIVPRGHTFMMNSRGVLDQAIHFYRHGRFDSSGYGSAPPWTVPGYGSSESSQSSPSL